MLVHQSTLNRESSIQHQQDLENISRQGDFADAADCKSGRMQGLIHECYSARWTHKYRSQPSAYPLLYYPNNELPHNSKDPFNPTAMQPPINGVDFHNIMGPNSAVNLQNDYAFTIASPQSASSSSNTQPFLSPYEPPFGLDQSWPGHTPTTSLRQNMPPNLIPNHSKSSSRRSSNATPAGIPFAHPKPPSIHLQQPYLLNNVVPHSL